MVGCSGSKVFNWKMWWVLLKKSVLLRRKICKYLGGFLEVSLVSCRVMIVGFWISWCMQGRDVLRVAMFQIRSEVGVEV